jgi:A/G-specific adenine glycosylase
MSKSPSRDLRRVKSFFDSSDSVAHFRTDLLGWFDANKRNLPWRNVTDPYRIWISEAMLQQTQVSRVIGYYERFLARFPSLATLAAAEPSEVLKAWEGLGYYSRARLLHCAAQRVANEFGGELPNDFERLRALPGFGDYTAAAVASIAFGRPVAAIDANVTRVVARLHGRDVGDSLTNQKNVVAERAAALLHPSRAGDFNQAMMELGAVVCTPRAPKCAACPVKTFCQAFALGEPSRWPLKKAKRPRPTVRAACIVVMQGEATLLVRRVDEKLLGNLWEPPGGALRDDESPEAGVRRIFREWFDASAASVQEIACVAHAFTHFKLRLHAFRCQPAERLAPPSAGRWATPADIERLPLTRAARKVLGMMRPVQPDEGRKTRRSNDDGT